jgi:hypothetical protein
MEQPGLLDETVQDARLLISRRWEGGGSRLGRAVVGSPGDAGSGVSQSYRGQERNIRAYKGFRKIKSIGRLRDRRYECR